MEKKNSVLEAYTIEELRDKVVLEEFTELGNIFHVTKFSNIAGILSSKKKIKLKL